MCSLRVRPRMRMWRPLSRTSTYVGTVVYSPQDEGAGIAELALADGCKTAVISAGASGDYAHDRRIIGFTEAFEAGGGEVLFSLSLRGSL